MKRFISALLVLYLVSEPLLFAQVFLPHRRKAFNAGIVYLLNENFEAAPGYDNVGWTETGTVNEDSTTSPLVGAQSLRLGGGSSIAWTQSPSWTAQSTVYTYFRFRTSGNPAATRRFFFIRDVSATDVCLIALNSDGTILVRAGTSGGNNTVGTLTAATDYHFWVKYIKGTGANATVECGFSTDGIKPSSGNNFQTHTTGNATTDSTHLGLGITTAVSLPTLDYDKIRVSASLIGDNPI